MTKLISIMIPVYNNEEHLNQLFNNLLNQTFEFNKMEIIFINDGSIDNSEKILKEFSSKYENITFLSNEKNMGAAYTRNKGIKTCTTDYLIFMDADDPYKKDFVEVHYNAMKKYDADIIKSNFNVNFNGKNNKISFKDNIMITKNFYEFPTTLLLIAGNGIYNLNFLKKNNIYFDENLKRSEDSLFHIECFVKSKKENVFLLNYIGSTWNIRNESLSHSFSIDLYNADWECYDKIMEILIENRIPIEFSYKFTYFKIIQQMLRFLNANISNEIKTEILKKQLYTSILELMKDYDETNMAEINFLK